MSKGEKIKNMILNKEEKKDFALFLMEKCKFSKRILDNFRDNLGYPIFFNDVYPSFDCLNFIREKEKELSKQGYLLYCVTFSCFGFGDCIEFLVVPKYKVDLDKIWQVQDNKIRLFAYVHNLNKPNNSEFGSVYYSLDNDKSSFRRIT